MQTMKTTTVENKTRNKNASAIVGWFSAAISWMPDNTINKTDHDRAPIVHIYIYIFILNFKGREVNYVIQNTKLKKQKENKKIETTKTIAMANMHRCMCI